MTRVPVIVGLGETLWDVFPDDPRLGGAPMNVLKLNDEELPQLVQLCGVEGSDVEILRKLAGRNIDQVNSRAIATAAYFCSKPGATMQFPGALRHGW